jgi:hypothetical protein
MLLDSECFNPESKQSPRRSHQLKQVRTRGRHRCVAVLLRRYCAIGSLACAGNEVDRRHTIARAAAILPALKWSISTLRCALVLNGLTFLAEMHKASVHAAEFAVQRPYTYRFPWFR